MCHMWWVVVRWGEMRFDETRSHEVMCILVTWTELSREEVVWPEMRWEEMRLSDVTWAKPIRGKERLAEVRQGLVKRIELHLTSLPLTSHHFISLQITSSHINLISGICTGWNFPGLRNGLTKPSWCSTWRERDCRALPPCEKQTQHEDMLGAPSIEVNWMEGPCWPTSWPWSSNPIVKDI